MRFDSLRAKPSLFDFVPCLAAHTAFDLFARQRDRQRIRPVIARRMREPPHQIVRCRREQPAAIFGVQLGLHADERDGLIAVIRDYEEDRQVTVVAVVDAEDRSFVLHVIRIDCDHDFFRGVVVVRRVGASGPRRGHHKFFRRNREETAEHDENTGHRKTHSARQGRAR